MSTSRAIKKPKRDDTQLSNWQSIPERAPSVERADSPTIARIVAMVGLFLAVLGGLAMYAPMWRGAAAISPDWGFRFASIGVCLLLFHAFVEHDFQFRRLYGFVGLALIIGGVVLRLMAFKASAATWFPYYGLPALTVGLVVVIAVIRNETETQFRMLMINSLGIVGALLIAFSAVMGMRSADFLAGEGVALLLLGLLYVSAYIGQNEAGSDRAHYAALAIGGIGVLGLAVGVIRSMLPEGTFHLVPSGLIIIGMSILYIAISVGMCSDLPIIVLARRDLAAYFYSPIAYLVLIGLAILGGFMFFFFVQSIFSGQMFEPIIATYIFDIWPVIAQMFIVPVLTMRLLSEEKRTGSLEVLLTAPVNEISVVLGKFLACWIFYMLTWLPWWLYLVSLRYIGNEPFDYLPVLSFTAALAVISAGLLAMGLFFSSMTSNQIIAAVLTFVGMMLHLLFFFLGRMGGIPEGTPLHEAIRYVNFFDLWQNSLGGIIAPRYLVFHLSVAIFFLFATVKMLESRKWK